MAVLPKVFVNGPSGAKYAQNAPEGARQCTFRNSGLFSQTKVHPFLHKVGRKGLDLARKTATRGIPMHKVPGVWSDLVRG
jgi:hypothetical protein